jgi:hypothetical protein
MRKLLLIAMLVLAGCPKKSAPPVEDDDTLPDPPGKKPEPEPPAPTTELQKRQYAACDRVIPRLTDCAVEDAKKNLSPEEAADAAEAAPIHTREYTRKCKNSYMSSRQVRVYEVCDREETECEPLVACLENAKPEKEP